MIPSPTLDRRLAEVDQCHVMGSRPVEERAILKTLKKIAQKGVLSLLLVAATAQAFAAAPQTPAIPSQDHPAAVMMVDQHEARFVETRVTQEGSHPEWVMGDGNVDGYVMVSAWRDADVSPANLYELVKVMIATQSPTITRTVEAALDAQRIAQETNGIFDIQSDAQATEFLKDHSLDALAKRDVISDSVAFIYRSGASDDVSDSMHLWERMGTNKNTQNEVLFQAQEDDTEMASAKAGLLKAVDEAGLSSLNVPLPYWGSSAQIKEMTFNIIQANHELQQATGWTGPVLGLNGRLSLTVGKPMDLGVAWVSGTSQFNIQGAWHDVSHEWLHAMDMAMRVDAGLPALMRTDLGIVDHNSGMTQALHAGQVPQGQAEAYSQWGDLNADLEKAGLQMEKPWHQEVQKKAESYSSDTMNDKWLNSYYQQPRERIAYAFSAHVENVVQGGHSALGGNPLNHDGVRGPSLQEAAHAAHVWTGAMELAKQQWWNPQMEALTAGVSVAATEATVGSEALPSLSIRVDMSERLHLRRASQEVVVPAPESAPVQVRSSSFR